MSLSEVSGASPASPRPDLASPPPWRAWRLPAPPPRDDVIRDCACGCRPRDHMLVRVGTLVALAECMDCECDWFDEKDDA